MGEFFGVSPCGFISFISWATWIVVERGFVIHYLIDPLEDNSFILSEILRSMVGHSIPCSSSVSGDYERCSVLGLSAMKRPITEGGFENTVTNKTRCFEGSVNYYPLCLSRDGRPRSLVCWPRH